VLVEEVKGMHGTVLWLEPWLEEPVLAYHVRDLTSRNWQEVWQEV